MKREDIHFVIDAFTPDTLPMERLSRYLAEFSALLGNEASVHFSKLETGSAHLVAYSDETAFPKIERRLQEVVEGSASNVAMKAHHDLDDLLAEDNAIGHIALGKAKIIEFPGRRRATQERIGPVRRATAVEGQIFSIGGKDETINVHLRDRGQEIRAEVSVALARQLAPYFLGHRIRLFGEGDWYRINSKWTRVNFFAFSYEQLASQTITEAVEGVQKLFEGVDPAEQTSTMTELRHG
jgi:hypothetical protein